MCKTGENYNAFGSCFSCHSDNKSLQPKSLSHVFARIVPLNESSLVRNFKSSYTTEKQTSK